MKSTLAVILTIAVASSPILGQMSFNKVELRNTYLQVKQGKKGHLVVDGETIRFQKKNGQIYFSLPTDAIKEIFYSRVSGRRIGAAILVTPFLLFSKGRKHYATLAFNDGKDLVGAVEFKLHKSNYRSCLRSIEQVTDLEMSYDQEGIKESEQTVSKRKKSDKDKSPKPAR